MKKNILFLLILLVLTACEQKPIRSAETSMEDYSKATIETSTTETDSKKINESITEAAFKATPLMAQIKDPKLLSDSYCAKITDKNEIKKIILDEDIASKLTISLDDFYSQKESQIGSAYKVCKKNKEIYVIFRSAVDPSFLIARWKDENSFDFFHDENSEMKFFGNDGGVTYLLVDAQSPNSLVYTAAQDSPAFYWTIDSLDPNTLEAREIENCKVTFDYNSQTFSVNTTKSILTCDKRYNP